MTSSAGAAVDSRRQKLNSRECSGKRKRKGQSLAARSLGGWGSLGLTSGAEDGRSRLLPAARPRVLGPRAPAELEHQVADVLPEPEEIGRRGV